MVDIQPAVEASGWQHGGRRARQPCEATEAADWQGGQRASKWGITVSQYWQLIHAVTRRCSLRTGSEESVGGGGFHPQFASTITSLPWSKNNLLHSGVGAKLISLHMHPNAKQIIPILTAHSCTLCTFLRPRSVRPFAYCRFQGGAPQELSGLYFFSGR